MGQDGSLRGVIRQAFSSTSQRIGPERVINTTNGDYQGGGDMVALTGARAVAIWGDWGTGTMRLQVLSSTGSRVGAEIVLPAPPALGEQSFLSLQPLAGGGFAVGSDEQVHTFFGAMTTFSLRYDTAGQQQGLPVALPLPEDVAAQDVLWQPDGRIAVLSVDFRAASATRFDLLLQVYGADGQPQGDLVTLAALPHSVEPYAQLELLDGHRFAPTRTAWDTALDDGNVMVQIFDADGAIAATVTGSAGNDSVSLIGTDARALIRGLADADRLGGAGGEDVLEGGRGNDINILNSTGDGSGARSTSRRVAGSTPPWSASPAMSCPATSRSCD